MIKNFIFTIIISIFLVTNGHTAGSSSSGGDGGSMKSNYEKAVSFIKSAKKLEKKGKIEKANKKKPNKPDTLNYLGFTTRKLGDFESGEKYYLQGLAINPTHIGINEYLGELYVTTGRHNLAVERLEILKGCSCKEYEQLKAIIAGEKVSKY